MSVTKSNFAAADHDPELEWYLCASDSALGLRSSLGAQIAAIERGGGSGGVPSDLPSSIAALDLLRPSAMPGARMRRCEAAWRSLDLGARHVLQAHYTLTLPTHTAGGSRQRFPAGVEARLGTLAGVACLHAIQSGTLAALLRACERGTSAPLAAAAKAAQTATAAAHAAFRAALRQTDARDFAATEGRA